MPLLSLLSHKKMEAWGDPKVCLTHFSKKNTTLHFNESSVEVGERTHVLNSGNVCPGPSLTDINLLCSLRTSVTSGPVSRKKESTFLKKDLDLVIVNISSSFKFYTNFRKENNLLLVPFCHLHPKSSHIFLLELKIRKRRTKV